MNIPETKSLSELKNLRREIEDKIISLEHEERVKNMKTRKQVIDEFESFGINTDSNTKIWYLSQDGLYGMEVGGYVHSCHIDTTDIKVLLVISENGRETLLKSIADLWATEVK